MVELLKMHSFATNHNQTRLRSSAWLEHWTFNPGVGGSNPLEAILEQNEIEKETFCFDLEAIYSIVTGIIIKF